MTVQEFKELIRVNVLDGQEVIINSENGKIQAIAVSTAVYQLASLQQAIGINIPDPVTGEMISINLQNSNKPYRRIDLELIDNYYVYSIYPIAEQEAIDDSFESEYSGTVVVETIKPSEVIHTYEYSALASQAVLANTSITRQVVDRNSQGEIRNLTSILTDSATPAEVQDSNYSKRNWTIPRYEGSKITTTSNGGVEPMQAGAFFQGATFSKETTDEIIGNQNTINAIIFKSYFSSGKLETPDYILEDINLQLIEGSPTIPEAVVINVETYQNQDNTPAQLYPGDLLLFQGYQEIVQIKPSPVGTQPSISPYIKYNQSSSNASGSLGISRNFNKNINNTVPITSETKLQKIQPVKMYSIDSTKLNLIANKKILIRDSGKILHTDNFGTVYSASYTP